MQSRFLEKRVEILERTVEGLAALPTRVEAVEEQISQLRTEMRGEFSAVRNEMHGGFAIVREEIRAGDEETRRQMQAMHDELVARITDGDQQTRIFARVLHEDTIARIAIVAEGQAETRQQLRALSDIVGGVREDVSGFHRDVIQRFEALGKQRTRRQRNKKS